MKVVKFFLTLYHLIGFLWVVFYFYRLVTINLTKLTNLKKILGRVMFCKQILTDASGSHKHIPKVVFNPIWISLLLTEL